MASPLYFVLVLCLTYHDVVADYECVCNYNVEKSVLPAPDLTSQPLGYMYEFDCKPSVPSSTLDGSEWQSVAFEHGIGYVSVDPNIQAQICQGSPSNFDVLTTTTTTTQSTTPTTPTTTQSTTVTTSTRTTPTTITTTLKPTTTRAPKPTITTTIRSTIKSTTPIQTAITSTAKPTTQTTTTIPTSTQTTTPKPTTTQSTTPKPTTTQTTTLKPTTETTTPTPTTTTTTPKPTTTQTTTPKPTTTQTTTLKPTTETTTPKPTTTTTTPTPTTKTTTPKPTTTQTTETTTPTLTAMTTTSSTTSTTTTPKPTTSTTLPPTTIDPIRGNTFLCPEQVKTNSNADRTPLGQHETSCYELLMTYKSTWSNAESKCNQRGGYLVDITDADEQKFVTKFLQNFTPNHAVWIGLNDAKSEGKFSWTSGSAVTYYNWYPGHSNHFLSHDAEDCAVIIPYENGQWDDMPCMIYHNTQVTYPAFCEYKIPQ